MWAGSCLSGKPLKDPSLLKIRDKALLRRLPLLDKGVFHAKRERIIHHRLVFPPGHPAAPLAAALSVRKLFYPVQHADGYLLPAYGTSVPIPGSLPGAEAESAFPVPVEMVVRKRLLGRA